MSTDFRELVLVKKPWKGLFSFNYGLKKKRNTKFFIVFISTLRIL